MDFRPISFWANWILIGALIVGVVATYGIVVSANVKESAANSKIAELNKETTKLSADAEASRAAIADANARAVEAQLALEKFKSPRSMTLEQQTRIEFVKGAAICAEISKFDLVT
jgi:outer membrane murein-binding lipoprotein Lpp